MTITRIVAQLDYSHPAEEVAQIEPMVSALYETLYHFAESYDRLELVVIGFAEAHDEPEEPFLRRQEDAAQRREQNRRRLP